MYLENNSADLGGGLYVSEGSITATRSTIIGNTGSAIFTSNGPVIVSDCRFENNYDATYGAGVWAFGFVTATDTVFISNTAKDGGAGLTAINANISGGAFQNNHSAETYGGGLYVLGEATITGTDFVSNSAQSGGGAYLATAVINNAYFSQNIATSFVGGGFLAGDLSLSHARIVDNSAADSGGGAFVWGTTSITDSEFMSNTAGLTAYGGGLFVSHAPAVQISNTLFRRNFAGQGGGLYVTQASGPVNVNRSRFEANLGDPGAGFLVDQSPDVMLIEPEVISNVVVGGSNYGAGVSCRGSIHVIGGRFENNSGTSMFGGGLYADTAFLTETQFISNSAALGGGIFIGNAAQINGGRFEHNTSTQSVGGAIAGGSFNLSGTVVTSNSAYSEGGGMHASKATTLTSVNFISNVAAFGGGVFSADNLTVYNSSFIGNQCVGATCGGGAVLANGILPTHANLVISNTQFLGNAATTPDSIGGAVYYGGNGGVYIVNTLFARNHAQQYGAALFLNWGEVANLEHLTIADESRNPVAALTVYSDMPVAINNSLIVSHAVGIQNVAGVILAGYNLFFGNFSNTTGVIGGGPNFSGDPKFVDPLNDDYHLQFGSAAIDHGVDAGVYTDLDGNPRPLGAGFDMGAYEYVAPFHIYLPLTLRKLRTGRSSLFLNTILKVQLSENNPRKVFYQLTNQGDESTRLDLRSFNHAVQ